MKVFTIESGTITPGTIVVPFTLSGGTTIPAIKVGEEGRGRSMGIIPVEGVNLPQIPCPNQGRGATVPRNYKEHKMNRIEPCSRCGIVYDYHEIQGTPDPEHLWFGHKREGAVSGPTTIEFATVGLSRSGKPKLYATSSSSDEETVLIVDRTGIGFRGGNSRTGDWTRDWCSRNYGGCTWCTPQDNERDTAGNIRRCTSFPANEGCQECSDRKLEFAPFPGKVLCSGTIAQGDAGRMGAGEEQVYTMPKNVVWRVGRSGRLYGAPGKHYFVWTGKELLVTTWEGRELLPDEHPLAIPAKDNVKEVK